jgi:hypothetical protein
VVIRVCADSDDPAQPFEPLDKVLSKPDVFSRTKRQKDRQWMVIYARTRGIECPELYF